MSELTHGIDDLRTDDIRTLAGNSTRLSQSLVMNEKPVTLSGVYDPSYAGGYMFLRYLAKQGSEHYGESYGTYSTYSSNVVSNSNVSSSNLWGESSSNALLCSDNFISGNADLTDLCSTTSSASDYSVGKLDVRDKGEGKWEKGEILSLTTNYQSLSTKKL